MTSSHQTPILPPQYLHSKQTRTAKQIELTNKLAQLLTESNIKRINEKKQQGYNKSEQLKQLFYFVCLCGIPPFEGQYENLGLPGGKTVVHLSGLMGKYTEEEYVEIFNRGGFQHQADKIRKVILQKCNQYKIVILYHSFGTFSFMNYLRLYPDHKISGIIDIGGATIRFYQLLVQPVYHFRNSTPQFLLQNAQQLHQAHSNNPKIKQAGFIPFENKYQTIIHLKLLLSPSFKDIFQYMRHLPKVLKLFIYGSKDRIFPDYLINEKAIHYNYVNKFETDYEKKLKQSYNRFYGKDCKNVQEKFMFRVIGGGHSVHMQHKYNHLIRQVIAQYLQVLKNVQ